MLIMSRHALTRMVERLPRLVATHQDHHKASQAIKKAVQDAMCLGVNLSDNSRLVGGVVRCGDGTRLAFKAVIIGRTIATIYTGSHFSFRHQPLA